MNVKKIFLLIGLVLSVNYLAALVEKLTYQTELFGMLKNEDKAAEITDKLEPFYYDEEKDIDKRTISLILCYFFSKQQGKDKEQWNWGQLYLRKFKEEEVDLSFIPVHTQKKIQEFWQKFRETMIVMTTLKIIDGYGIIEYFPPNNKPSEITVKFDSKMNYGIKIEGDNVIPIIDTMDKGITWLTICVRPEFVKESENICYITFENKKILTTRRKIIFKRLDWVYESPKESSGGIDFDPDLGKIRTSEFQYEKGKITIFGYRYKGKEILRKINWPDLITGVGILLVNNLFVNPTRASANSRPKIEGFKKGFNIIGIGFTLKSLRRALPALRQQDAPFDETKPFDESIKRRLEEIKNGIKIPIKIELLEYEEVIDNE